MERGRKILLRREFVIQSTYKLVRYDADNFIVNKAKRFWCEEISFCGMWILFLKECHGYY